MVQHRSKTALCFYSD